MANDSINGVESAQSPQTLATTSTVQKYSVDSGSTRNTRDILINGINYNITAEGVFEYEVDGDQITFIKKGANSATIKGDKNAKHNVVLKSNYMYFMVEIKTILFKMKEAGIKFLPLKVMIKLY